MSLLGWRGLDRKSWLQALRSSARIIIIGLSGIILAWVILRIASPTTDHDLALGIYNTGMDETVARAWWVIASIGDLIWVPLIFWLYVFRSDKHDWTSSVVLAVAMVSAMAATDILKAAFNLPRPFKGYPLDWPSQFVRIGNNPTNAAYPSGHTTNAFTVATIIWARYKAWRAPFLALAIGTGIGMIVLGYHFPSDVIAGACLGMIAGSFALSMAKLRSDGQPVTG